MLLVTDVEYTLNRKRFVEVFVEGVDDVCLSMYIANVNVHSDYTWPHKYTYL